MTWNDTKKLFPVGDIRNWRVKVVRGYLVMADDDTGVNAILEATCLSDTRHFPIEYPSVGTEIKCVVLGHTPVDQKVRLSAKGSDLAKALNQA